MSFQPRICIASRAAPSPRRGMSRNTDAVKGICESFGKVDVMNDVP
jgi:hypothetical protein